MAQLAPLSPHKHQTGPEAMGDLASVIPSDAHAIILWGIADYNAGRFSRVKPYTSPEE
jgi:hypothetical protein